MDLRQIYAVRHTKPHVRYYVRKRTKHTRSIPEDVCIAYGLRLAGNRYYYDWSRQAFRRLKDELNGRGGIITKIHLPVEVIFVSWHDDVKSAQKAAETAYKEAIQQYGEHRVRRRLIDHPFDEPVIAPEPLEKQAAHRYIDVPTEYLPHWYKMLPPPSS